MVSIWKLPPKIKVYEALGAIADGRVVINGNTARVGSSTGNKEYAVTFNLKNNQIMANDNGSYWQGYLGYPAIAVLMLKNKILYNIKVSGELKDISWKKLNKQYKNNWDKTIAHIHQDLQAKGISIAEVEREVQNIMEQLSQETYYYFGKKIRPPKDEK